MIRYVLGKIVLALDALFAPTPQAKRTPVRQAAVDQETAGLVIYQFVACPFCVKVRRTLKRLNLKVELRDAAGDSAFREELQKGGGKIQVPCLRIPQMNGGSYRWMYESSEIISYLSTRFRAS